MPHCSGWSNQEEDVVTKCGNTENGESFRNGVVIISSVLIILDYMCYGTCTYRLLSPAITRNPWIFAKEKNNL